MLSIKSNLLSGWTNVISTSTGAPPGTPCQVPASPVYGGFTVPSGSVYTGFTVVSGPSYGSVTVPASPTYGCGPST